MGSVTRFFVPPERSYFLLGPRGTGKSTAVRAAYPHARWLDLLDPALQHLYSAHPERLREFAVESYVGILEDLLLAYGQRDISLSFWRTRSGNEVDFIVYGPRDFVAIEVKNAARFRDGDLRGLRSFLADYPEARAIFLYRGHEKLLKNQVLCWPCDEFLKRLDPRQPFPGSR